MRIILLITLISLACFEANADHLIRQRRGIFSNLFGNSGLISGKYYYFVILNVN